MCTRLEPIVFNTCSNDYGQSGALSSSSFKKPNDLAINFCAANTVDAANICASIGSDNEWIALATSTGTCEYVSGYNPSTAANSICATSKGNTYSCIRQSFQADPLQCCIQDYKGCTGARANTNLDKCFTGTTSTNCANANCTATCSPCYQDITSTNSTTPNGTACTSNCSQLMFDYCTGGTNPSDDSFLNNWLPDATGSSACLNFVLRNLYKPIETGQVARDTSCEFINSYLQELQNSSSSCRPTSFLATSNTGLAVTKKLFNQFMINYNRFGYNPTASVGQIGYSPIANLLKQQICCAFPQVCAASLKATCSSYTSSQVETNSSIADWCGCYMKADNYTEYINEYQVNLECTPTCNRPTSIVATNAVGQPLNCTQTTCIIDDVSVNLVDSYVGNLNVSQICGNCSSGCTCLISDDTVNGFQTKIANINISQSCSSYTCSVTNGSASKTINCNSTQAQIDSAIQSLGLDNTIGFWTWLAIIVAIIIFLAAIVFFFSAWSTGHAEKVTTTTSKSSSKK